ncbi:MAG: hypothetical protein WC718_14985 [Phycisphaerales bacterium]
MPRQNFSSSGAKSGEQRDVRALIMGVGAGAVVLGCLVFLSMSWKKLSGNERVTIQPTPEYLESIKPLTDDLSRLKAMTLPELEKEMASRKAAANAAASRRSPDYGELEGAYERCADAYNAAVGKAQQDAQKSGTNPPADGGKQ